MEGRRHSMPFGAEVLSGGAGVRFRLWAPALTTVSLCLEDGTPPLALAAVGDGWFELCTDRAAAGSRYRYQIDGGLRVPDPASRFQPEDVHGPSEVIDPLAWHWRDAQWRGRPWHEAVLYEVHVGTFSAAGDYAGVEARLDHLAALGVTALQLMPLGDFPGARGWGYDGVLPFAPDSRYGRPEQLKQLVAAAHARGLLVLLDVVYNHFGPEGNYLHQYAPSFFTHRHTTPWGDAINFDGAHSAWVRAFFIHNACYWLEEYGLDGLRLDAVHAIHDDSRPDILEALATAVHEGVGRRRPVHLLLENDDNAAHYLVRRGSNTPGLYTAQWNDDLHHVLHLLLSGERGGYYSDYSTDPLSLLGRALAEGLVYQGEWSAYRGRRRGEPCNGLAPDAFIAFLQNHDQIGNRPGGERLTLLARTAALRAAVALLLLAPAPPQLFMGEEWGCRQPFPFFCDFEAELAQRVDAGRRQEVERLLQHGGAPSRLPALAPNDPATAEAARLDWDALAAPAAQAWLALYRELLALRRREIVPRLAGMTGAGRYRVEQGALALEWRLGDGTTLRLLANLSDVPLAPASPPGQLLYTNAPAPGAPWAVTYTLEPPP